MVGSGEGEHAGAEFGNSEQSMEGSGGGAHDLLHSLDYPCTTRLRLRRLLSYLRGHNHAEIYQAAKGKMRVVFHLRDLVKQVEAGQWREAILYIHSFAPFNRSGYETRLLTLFLQDLMALNDFADGYITVPKFLCNSLVSIYRKPVLANYPCLASLVADVLFLRSDHARAFLDWQLVRTKAAKMVKEMAYDSPELRDRMHYPRGRKNLYHVVSIAFRRPVKKAGRKQSTDLAQFYAQMKKRLPSSNTGASHSSSGSARIEDAMLIPLLEKALQAGRHLELEQCLTPECSSQQGFPFVQAMLANGFMVNSSIRREVQHENSSKKDISESTAAMASSEIHPERTLQAGRHLELKQGHTPTSKHGLPIVQDVLANGSMVNPLRRYLTKHCCRGLFRNSLRRVDSLG